MTATQPRGTQFKRVKTWIVEAPSALMARLLLAAHTWGSIQMKGTNLFAHHLTSAKPGCSAGMSLTSSPPCSRACMAGSTQGSHVASPPCTTRAHGRHMVDPCLSFSACALVCEERVESCSTWPPGGRAHLHTLLHLPPPQRAQPRHRPQCCRASQAHTRPSVGCRRPRWAPDSSHGQHHQQQSTYQQHQHCISAAS